MKPPFRVGETRRRFRDGNRMLSLSSVARRKNADADKRSDMFRDGSPNGKGESHAFASLNDAYRETGKSLACSVHPQPWITSSPLPRKRPVCFA